MTIPHQQNGQPTDTRPLTCDQAETLYPGGSRGAVARFSELSQRDLSARAAAILQERGKFDPENNLGHQVLAEAQPLAAPERLEHMAIGEMLARHYRHPAMLDQAAKAGPSWEQIGAARGTSADQARADYRAWANGQHSLLSYGDGKFGMPDADYAAAYARSADPETYSKGTGGRSMAALVGARGSAVTGLCVHAGPLRSGPTRPGWLPVLAPSPLQPGPPHARERTRRPLGHPSALPKGQPDERPYGQDHGRVARHPGTGGPTQLPHR
jgi:hypothetical protein